MCRVSNLGSLTRSTSMVSAPVSWLGNQNFGDPPSLAMMLFWFVQLADSCAGVAPHVLDADAAIMVFFCTSATQGVPHTNKESARP
jgi:hypothetical protein